jgi:prepilin-type N-terminal cleavage/methylation domain-containing protein
VKARGFTILEISVVLVIAGLLMFVVLRATGLIGSANAKDLMTVTQDLSTALREFKARYKLYPGDFGISSEIAGVSAKCLAGGANGGNNNGIIEANESVCVPEVLFRAGFIGKSAVDATGTYTIATSFGNASIIAASASGVTMPARVLHVVTFQNVPCDIALQVDRSLDDGNLNSGTVAASVATCTPGGANDPVPLLAVGL